MARYEITIKRSATIKRTRVEAGMSVEIVTRGRNSTPWAFPEGKQAITEAFERIYGIDVLDLNICNNAWMECEEL